MLHDYLHCLVFKEQSVYRLSFQATHLSYRIQLSLSTSFLENFQSFAAVQKLATGQGLLGFCLPCLSATCIILHESGMTVNTIFKFILKNKEEPYQLPFTNYCL
jgi:hypothetical protein